MGQEPAALGWPKRRWASGCPNPAPPIDFDDGEPPSHRRRRFARSRGRRQHPRRGRARPARAPAPGGRRTGPSHRGEGLPRRRGLPGDHRQRRRGGLEHSPDPAARCGDHRCDDASLRWLWPAQAPAWRRAPGGHASDLPHRQRDDGRSDRRLPGRRRRLHPQALRPR